LEALSVLSALPTDHEMRHMLLADAVAARLPLSQAEWALLPRSCEGLGRALPTALKHSPQQARELVRRLGAEDAARLHTAALALARTQQQLPFPLPGHVVERILSLVLCD
jgi:hypothetical protein